MNLLRLRHLLVAVALFPLAVVGTLLHLPAYYLIRYIAFKYSGDEMAVVATTKLVAGLLLFPLSWILWGVGVAAWSGEDLWLLVIVAGPPLGFLTMVVHDSLASLAHHSRLLSKARTARLSWDDVVSRRAVIAEQMAVLMAEIQTT